MPTPGQIVVVYGTSTIGYIVQIKHASPFNQFYGTVIEVLTPLTANCHVGQSYYWQTEWIRSDLTAVCLSSLNGKTKDQIINIIEI